MIEVILDASQLETFEKCPYAWYLDHVCNLTTRRTNPAFSTGTFFHEALKYYYTRGISEPLDSLIKDTLLFAKDIAYSIEARTKYPEIYKDPKFFLERLRSYLFKYIDEDSVAKIIAVEKGFSWLLFEDNNRRYILEGMIDLVWEKKPTGFTVTDHKTQSRKYDKFEYNHQALNYLSFTRANYFEYNYIGLQDAESDNTFRRPIFKPAPGMLKQWQSDVKKTFDQMYHYKKTILELGGIPEEVYARRRAACTTQFGICAWHKLCLVPDDSKYRIAIEAHYKQKDTEWKAWS